MADQLTQVMHEQADTMPFELDADAVLAAGRRRLVRRRLTAGAAGVTAGCLALLGFAVVGRDADRAQPPVATQSMESGSFAMGSMMRRDGKDLLTDSSVTSYVRVPGGNVFTAGDGTVRLLPARRLDPVDIGRTAAASPHLVADPAHDRVAWVSPSPGAATFVVHDVGTGADRVAFAETGRDGTGPGEVGIYALDGDVLYVHDARGVVRLDLRDDSAEVLSLRAGPGSIGSAAGGLLAWRSPVASKGYVVGHRFGDGVPTGRTERPMLSPEGTFLSTDDDAGVHVQRTSDGEDVALSLPTSYVRAIAYGWSDDDHLLVAGITSRPGRRVTDFVFLTCAVDEGSCAETGEEGHATPATFNLPFGRPAADLAESLRH